MNIKKIRDEIEISFNEENDLGLRFAWFGPDSDGFLSIFDGKEKYYDTEGVRETWN